MASVDKTSVRKQVEELREQFQKLSETGKLLLKLGRVAVRWHHFSFAFRNRLNLLFACETIVIVKRSKYEQVISSKKKKTEMTEGCNIILEAQFKLLALTTEVRWYENTRLVRKLG